MKKSKKVFALLTAAVLAMGMFTGCGDDSSGNSSNTSGGSASSGNASSGNGSGDEISTSITGSISLAGSTSMEKLVTMMDEAFMEQYPGVNVSAEFIGSTSGVEAAQAGRAQIANVSRDLSDEEIASGMVQNVVAIDGIAVVVNNDNTVEDLTKEQLAQIYTGEVTNWSEVGGNDSPIVVIGREASSGTREAFETIVDVEEKCAYSNELDNTGAVMAKVSATEGAIGYVSLDVVDDSIKTLKLEGVEATAENILNDTYFLSRPFVMATNGTIENQDETVQAYFQFIQSEMGKTVIENVGLIVPAEE